MHVPSPPPTYWAYDIETYPNCFTVIAQRTDTPERVVFEISDRRNDAMALYEWIHGLRGAVMVGFNNLGFDYPVLHHCLTVGPLTAAAAYAKAQAIIDSQGDDNRWAHMVWPSDMIVPQLDLYKIHHFDNRAKSTGLKALEIAMRSESVEDLPFPVGVELTSEQIDLLLEYNAHDVTETIKFFHASRGHIDFRRELTDRYGKDFTNHNDTKIGKDFFIMELEKAGVPCFFQATNGRRQPRQTYRADGIPVADILFPYVHFRDPELNRVLEYLRTVTIRDTKAAPELKDLSATVNGFTFDFGTGGIHGSVKNRIVRSDATYVVLDVDVASMYPNIAIANRVYPEHLSETFCDVYASLYEQRKSYPKGTAENAMLKLALNGVYGDSNNVYSPFYDPAYTMTITINGQLSLCMLGETLMAEVPGLEMIQANTDGLTARLPRTSVDQFRDVCAQWEATTGLALEEATYSMMAIRDVNNYLAVSESGKVKRKGAYEYDLDWHQDPSALVVQKAVEASLLTGADVADLIEWHSDPFDFMLRAKVPRSSRLETSDGKALQNTTRYYITHEGPSLVKIMPPLPKKEGERRIGINVGWSVGICNRAEDFDWSRLNRAYYVKEARKLLDVFS